MYGVEGAVGHHNTDLWGDAAPQDNYAPSTFWPSGFAWLVTHVFEHYLFTGDVSVLREHYDALRDSAVYFLNFVTDYKGWKVTSPSLSPENSYYLPNSTTATAALTLGPTMDNSIIWAVFGMVLEAQRVLGVEDAALAANLTRVRALLPPLRVSPSLGGIMEWIEDYRETEPGHRHWSPLFGLYPGSEITADDARLFAAARRTIDRRLSFGGGESGWSRGWAIALAARAHNASLVSESLHVLLTKCTYPRGMLNTGGPAAFQIDGNFGGTAGVAEALLQSHEQIVVVAAGGGGNATNGTNGTWSNSQRRDSTNGTAPLRPARLGDDPASKVPLIRLLPALPAAWAGKDGGSVRGLVARGGFEVDIEWDADGGFKNATLTSRLGSQAWLTVGTTPIGKSGAKEVAVAGQGKGEFVLVKTKKGDKLSVSMG